MTSTSGRSHQIGVLVPTGTGSRCSAGHPCHSCSWAHEREWGGGSEEPCTDSGPEPTALETLPPGGRQGSAGPSKAAPTATGGCPGPCPRPAGTTPTPCSTPACWRPSALLKANAASESAAAPGEMFSLGPEKQTKQEALPLQDDREKRIRLTGEVGARCWQGHRGRLRARTGNGPCEHTGVLTPVALHRPASQRASNEGREGPSGTKVGHVTWGRALRLGHPHQPGGGGTPPHCGRHAGSRGTVKINL